VELLEEVKDFERNFWFIHHILKKYQEYSPIRLQFSTLSYKIDKDLYAPQGQNVLREIHFKRKE
jgi:hypothetical protein